MVAPSLSVFSRRAPFPWSLEFDLGDGVWHGVMLAPTDAGLMTGKLTDFLAQVTPTSYEYGAARPDEESTFVFGRLVGGMGEKIQSSATSKRYRYAVGVDCSIGGMPRLGPQFTPETFPGLPAGPSEVVQIIEHNPLVSDLVIVLVGHTAYARTGGAWSLSHDFLAGNLLRQGTLFTGTTGGGGLWVTTANGELWLFNGTTWAKSTIATAAVYVAAVREQLWVAGFASVRVASQDPLLDGSFGGAILVGDQGKRITYLAPVDDVMYVFKQEGIFTVNADGSVNELRPELRAVQYLSNGRNAVAWRDALWFSYGDAFYALDPGGAMQPVGPERLAENDSPVRGAVVSSAPHADWFLYAGVYNAATGASHLLKYGTWTPGEGATAPANYHFDDVWHGALASWAGKRVTRIDVGQRDPAGNLANLVLWVGFADGTVQWTTLPAGTPDPAIDAACRFAAAGQLFWPLHDAVFGADQKAFHGVTALGPRLSATQSARQYWRVDPAAAYAALTPDLSANGQRVEFPDLTTGAPRDSATGLQLDAYTELRTTVSTATPVLEGVALHEAVRPAAGKPSMRLGWTATIQAANRVVRRDGVVSFNRAEQILGWARAAATAAGHVRVRGPDGVVVGIAAVSYEQVLAPEAARDGLTHSIAVRFVQLR